MITALIREPQILNPEFASDAFQLRKKMRLVEINRNVVKPLFDQRVDLVRLQQLNIDYIGPFKGIQICPSRCQFHESSKELRLPFQKSRNKDFQMTLQVDFRAQIENLFILSFGLNIFQTVLACSILISSSHIHIEQGLRKVH